MFKIFLNFIFNLPWQDNFDISSVSQFLLLFWFCGGYSLMNFFSFHPWNLQHQGFFFFYDLYIFIKLLVLPIVCCFLAFVQVSYCIFCRTLSYLKWLFWILHWLNHTKANLWMWILKIFILCCSHDTLSSFFLKFCGAVFVIKLPVSFDWKTTSFNPSRDSAAISDLL